MKLICVNNSPMVLHSKIWGPCLNMATGLEKGKTYETNSEPFMNEHGFECYYIVDLDDAKLRCRFAEMIPDEEKKKTRKKKVEFEPSFSEN